ncbi:hypothetical protein BCV69DRAFT_6394 [Microstroma glucosiphilum]|uniref:Uncharacterized protein n=1 Tax=Pseudomicrostroma glucosiphilum TaxID=1684307 RepID=A0A316UEJ0_9BASI|nr:hypothetical protein BCV69DRAFT_6394 [Pseudomicrostroma glucosiphilum]PWN23639.1 hypothetical protein BCV69DRAFT_6394 [Pseudomicrostroma glucosiphilum]
MASKPSSSSAPASSRKVQVHNKQHSLRAVSKSKLSQQQKEKRPAVTPASSSSLQPISEDGLSHARSHAAGQSHPSGSRVALGKRKEADSSGDNQAQRRQVFKQVLASPLTVNWPQLAAVDAQPILYTLLDMLALPALRSQIRRVQPMRPDRRVMSRGESRRARKSGTQSRGETQAIGLDVSTSVQMDVDEVSSSAGDSSAEPVALVCGINSVTRHMELEIARESSKRGLQDGEQDSAASASPLLLSLVFVCRSDLDPPKLASHFPMLTCALNAVCHPASREGAAALLIPLPAGAELVLAKALGLRRCSALGIATGSLPQEISRALSARIADAGLQPLRADWLDTAADSALRTREALLTRSGLIPMMSGIARPMRSNTIVKNVASTAPANLNEVKLQKKHTRNEKKAWRKAVKKAGHGEGRKRVIEERRRRREARRRGDTSMIGKEIGKKDFKAKDDKDQSQTKATSVSSPMET